MAEEQKLKQYVYQAHHFPIRLPLKVVAESFKEAPFRQGPLAVVLKLAEESFLFAFNFGTLVFFNVSDEERKRILAQLYPVLGGTQPRTGEDFILEVDPSLPAKQFHEAGFNQVRVKDLDADVLRILALVIGESAALEFFEEATEDLLHKSGEISNQLKKKGRTTSSMKELLKFIGLVLSTKQEIIADLYVVDAPDEVWTNQRLDRLYGDMKREFEIETRYKVLQFKLEMVQDTVEIVADLLRFRSSSNLEVIIIVLIAAEFCWFIWEYFVKN